ncbi:HD domain-containing protein [Fusibacter bizertensis]|uniref:HD domain-containing protein n=1 Tax=Fusibacter bizertensis TaxID=1488331 RepID=A0ABT6NFI1_9FIRM|nr:HD domain-containing phosphohydrolase [Fusibacter bizertensis]MDH8679192.1 HD domain-containing protein [Fusibacter bizertensis]
MKNSYYNKIKWLLLLFIYLPVVVFSIGLIAILASTEELFKQWFFIVPLLLIETLIAYLVFRKKEGLFKDEILSIETLDVLKLEDATLIEKIESLSRAQVQLNQLLFNIASQHQVAVHDIGYFNDLTFSDEEKVKILEHEIKVQEKIDHSLIDLTSQFVLQLNKDGKVMKMNRAFSMRLGYQESEIIGVDISELLKREQDEEMNPIAGSVENQIESQNIIWMEKLRRATDEPLFINMKMKATNPYASEHISMVSNKLDDGTLLCIGKPINDEIALQSNILRKNRELEYINQINASLISNWNIEALLDNIIQRIDYLFNTTVGGIYVLDSQKKWNLNSFGSKELTENEILELNLDRFFTKELLSKADIEVIPVKEKLFNFLILAPLEVDNEVIAILVLAMEQEMNSNDISILKMFKNQASMVIQRAIIYDQLRKQYFGTIEALVNVIEAKDKYTEGHSRRVSRFSVEIAKEIGYSNEEVENIEIAGLLHDIGKIGIEQNILAKRGKLTEEEYEVIKEHPSKGIQILEAISFDEKIREGILYHHLRYDLKGYPKAELKELPIYASIIGIADAFDAITSARSYSQARTKEEALKEVIKYKGSQFEPRMVDVLQKIIEENPQKIQDIINDIEVVHLDL